MLENQTFNCVSSATLFNILARKMGLDARGIEVPDHAFSILYDGTKHVDIETTTTMGFNPARSREALARFQQQTGFVYIPDRNRNQRREVGETGMVAITYYNHGVTFAKQKKYEEALICYFKTLSLDPNNKSAVKNVLAALTNWSAELSDKEEFRKAIDVLTVGLTLAPKDSLLKSNNVAVWMKYISNQVAAGKSSETLDLLKTTGEKLENVDLDDLRSAVFLIPARALAKKESWQEAIDLVAQGIEKVDEPEPKRSHTEKC